MMILPKLLWVRALCGLLLYAEGFRLRPQLRKEFLINNCHQLPTSLQSILDHSGLLEGVPDVSSSALFYSPKISLPQAAALVKNKSLLYEIVKADCQNDEKEINQYLDEIKCKLKEFMEKNEVFNREDLKRGLRMVTEDKGNFACLLGGKSTGKSLVLNEFSREEVVNKKVIYIDLRMGYSSITDGFIDVIKKSKNQGWKDAISEWAVDNLENLPLPIGVKLDFSSLASLLKKEKDPVLLLESMIGEMVSKSPKDAITLVVDEANLALTINDKTSEAKIEQVKAALSLFTRLTKQEKKVSLPL